MNSLKNVLAHIHAGGSVSSAIITIAYYYCRHPIFTPINADTLMTWDISIAHEQAGGRANQRVGKGGGLMLLFMGISFCSRKIDTPYCMSEGSKRKY